MSDNAHPLLTCGGKNSKFQNVAETSTKISERTFEILLLFNSGLAQDPRFFDKLINDSVEDLPALDLGEYKQFLGMQRFEHEPDCCTIL